METGRHDLSQSLRHHPGLQPRVPFCFLHSVEHSRSLSRAIPAKLAPTPSTVTTRIWDPSDSHRLLAVADGLSFWNKYDMAGGKYATKLCQRYHSPFRILPSIEQLYKSHEPEVRTNPKLLLERAVTNSADTLGASTCCFTMLNGPEKVLRAVNIGDSGFIVLRKEAFSLRNVLRSVPRTKEFDFPMNVSERRNKDRSEPRATCRSRLTSIWLK